MTIKTLIVDDSVDTLETLAIHFGSYAEIEIIATAQNIQQAMDICFSTHVDLISIDIQLGGESGFQLCRMVRLMYPTIFIVMCSIEADFECKQFASELGANYFLSKPVSFNDSAQLIAAYLEFRNAKRPTLSRTDDNQLLELLHRINESLGRP